MNYIKGLFLVTWSVFLTMVTFVLGAIPMHGLRQLAGRGLFVSINICVLGALYGLQYFDLMITYGSVFVLVLAYNEFKRRDLNLFEISLFSVLAVSAFQAVIFMYWALQNPGWYGFLVERTDKFLVESSLINPKALQYFSVSDLVAQFPSAIFIVSTVMLLLVILFEGKISSWLQLPNAIRLEPVQHFKAPDFFIWIFIASLLGAFYKMDYKLVSLVSLNVLNICIVIYFFQGLAVVSHFFAVFKVGVVWKALWYMILVVQLFLLVSCIGILDYWMNFRARFQKKATEIKKRSF